MLAEFFFDVFDQRLERATLMTFIDATQSTIDYAAMWSSPYAHLGVAFHTVWKNVYHVFPSKLDFMNFVKISGCNAAASLADGVAQSVAFIIRQTFYKHLRVDAAALDKMRGECFSAAERIIRRPDEVKRFMEAKLLDRFGFGPGQVLPPTLSSSLQQPLYTTYTALMVAYHAQVLPAALARIGYTPTERQALLTKMPDVYALSAHVLRERDLTQRNLLTGGVNATLMPPLETDVVCLDDALRYTLVNDHYFMRHVFGTPAVYVHLAEQDPEETTWVEQAIACFDAAVKESVTVYWDTSNGKDLQTSCLPDHAYIHVYQINEPMLRFIPRLHTQFMLITDSLEVATRLQDALPLARSSSAGRLLIRGHRPAAIAAAIRGDAAAYDHVLCAHAPGDPYEIASNAMTDRIRVYHWPYAPRGKQQRLDPCSLGAALHALDMSKHVMRTSLNSRCPFRCARLPDYATRFNYLYVLDALMEQFNARASFRIPTRAVTESGREGLDAVLLVDTRPSVMSILCLLLTLSNLDSRRWHVHVVTCGASVEYYRGMLGGAEQGVFVHTHPDLREHKFSVEEYSALLKQASFWELFTGYDKVLTVQDDAVLIRPQAERRIRDTFGAFDYVGAPWVQTHGNQPLRDYANPEFVGNGGLSLRTQRVMKEICARHSPEHAFDIFHTGLQTDPEDVYFSRYVHRDGYKLCPQNLARQFSSEEILDPSTIGIHKPWMYHPIYALHAFMQSLRAP